MAIFGGMFPTRSNRLLWVCALWAWSSTGFQAAAQHAVLRFDHLVFFVPDSSLEQALTEQLFHAAEKLATAHPGQGTEGRYVLFLNTSIEFLYLRDSAAARRNEDRFGSRYTQRWEPAANPIAFGLIAEPFDTTVAGFHTYHGPDQPEGEHYLMAEGNTDLAHPLVYASMPHRGHKTLSSMEEVERADPAIRDDLRHYLGHPSGIRRLSRIVLTVPVGELGTGNTALLQELEGVEVHEDDGYALLLEFDGAAQNGEFRWSEGLDLVIRY